MVDETRAKADNRGMNLLRSIARPLLAAPFFFDGLDALRSPEDHAERAAVLLPLLQRVAPDLDIDEDDLRPLSRILAGITIGASLGFASGKAPRTSAAVLAGIALPMAVVNAPVWTAQTRTQRRELALDLVRRLAFVGGLAIASADRVGQPSTAWRLANWKEQREKIADVRATERARLSNSGGFDA